MERLKVQNGQIVKTSGDPIYLRGYNIGGWLNMEDFINGFVGVEHNLRSTMARIIGQQRAQFFFDRLLDYFFCEDDVKAMSEMGANVLRLPFNYRHFERDNQPFEYLENGFKHLDQAFEWCARYGIYIILDFHAVQGWQNPDWHSDNAHIHILLYQDRLFQDRFIALWQEIARRYHKHPALVGYDLMNEPLTRLEYERYKASYDNWDVLNALHRRAAAAIREIDEEHIIFIEGDNFSTEYDGLDATFDDNLVISTHNYISPTGGSNPYPGEFDGIYWNRDIIAAEFGMHSGTRLAFKERKPIFVGEFGVWYAGYPEALVYRVAALDDQLSVFSSAGVHWAIWTWKDIASMGSYNLDPESEYVQKIAPILKAKQEVSDWEGEMPEGAVAKAFKDVADTIDGYLRKNGFKIHIDRRWFTQYSLFGYLAQFLQVPYANIFEDMSEKEIDQTLQAFHIKKCIANNAVLETVKKFLA